MPNLPTYLFADKNPFILLFGKGMVLLRTSFTEKHRLVYVFHRVQPAHPNLTTLWIWSSLLANQHFFVGRQSIFSLIFKSSKEGQISIPLKKKEAKGPPPPSPSGV